MLRWRCTSGNGTRRRNRYRRSCSSDEQNPRAWNNLGVLLAHGGEVEESTRCFERAIAWMLAPGGQR